jgi:hypothetical protein
MTKASQPNLTKTCSNCGQHKPLSAFLEMSGTQGSAYGNICSSCRKTAMEAAERRKKTEAEGSTTSETGHKIDSKTKVHDAIDKRELFQRVEEDYHEERKLEEEISEEKIIIKQNIEIGQKKHRQDFLGKRPPIPGDQKTINSLIARQQQIAAMNADANRENENTALQTHGLQEEGKKTPFDFTVGQQVAQLRFSGAVFQQFRQWLGNSAPIVHNVNQTTKQVAPKLAGAIAQAATHIKDSDAATGKHSVEEDTIDPAIEFVENNFRPGSKR